MLTPTGKARAEMTAAILALALGLALRQPGLVLLAAVLVAHLALGLFGTPVPAPRLRALRRVSAGVLAEGERLEVVVEVASEGAALERVVVEDAVAASLGPLEGQAWAEGALPAGGRLALRYAAWPRRGWYALPAVRVQIPDPLGYRVWGAELPCPATVVALPRVEPLGGLQAGPWRPRPVPGTARARRGGAGSQWLGVREHRPGEPVRRVYWPALARWGRLAVVEFEAERAAEIVVVLDVRARAYPPETAVDLLDAAARAAAALCDAFLREGHRVGLLLYGIYLDWLPPGQGRRHARRLGWHLARARLGASEVFADLGRIPARLVRPGVLLVVVSPLAPGDEEHLGRLARRGPVWLLVPEPPRATASPGERAPEQALAERLLAMERRAALRRLRRAGVRALAWDARRPLAPLLHAAWRRAPWP